jgi:hypothetical protein
LPPSLVIVRDFVRMMTSRTGDRDLGSWLPRAENTSLPELKSFAPA